MKDATVISDGREPSNDMNDDNTKEVVNVSSSRQTSTNPAESSSANAESVQRSNHAMNIDTANEYSSKSVEATEKLKRKNPEIISENKATNASSEFPAVSSPINPPLENKRQRIDQTQSYNTPEENLSSFNAIESLLSVPIHYICHKTSSQNKNAHLLSRMEASLLLQITTLAYELDTLLQMSIEAVEISHACNIFCNNIDESRNVFLRPLHCLLHTHGRVIPQQVVQHVQNHLEGILGHFPVVIQSLRQCAEQNWSVSNALLGMSVDGLGVGMLGKEKGLLAELEEEVCKRMEGLMDVCNQDGLMIENSFDEESMEYFCERLFGKKVNNNGDGDDDSSGQEPLLSIQNRTESIHDAASTLGLLAAGGASSFDV